jgi:glycosyltransferase involved in cell wall biosynthesis
MTNETAQHPLVPGHVEADDRVGGTTQGPSAAHDRSVAGLARVLDVELSRPVPIVPGGQDGARVPQAWVLVRLFGEPVGLLSLDVPDQGLAPPELLEKCVDGSGSRLDELLTARGLTRSSLTVSGLGNASAPANAVGTDSRAAGVGDVRLSLTVAVCTRDRPQQLTRTLESLARQRHRDFDVVVVDNAPTTEETAAVVDRFSSRLPVRCVVEPRPGLSRAKNRALREASGDFVAYIDDDEVADPGWVEEFGRALRRHPRADAVTGLIVPAELDTQAQLWFEQFGGHSKGRGCHPAVLTADSVFSPLYPLPPFGAGGNAVIRRSALEAVGGFDEALGAGTRTRGSEDTKLFTQLLLRGGEVIYWPSAFVRHLHRRDYEGLRGQMSGYGRGITAFYTALVVDDPRLVISLLKLAPRALREMTAPVSERVLDLGRPFPADLLRAERRGMLAGPFAYVAQRCHNRGSR